ncbi:histone-lysine N-methyltransferase EHMT1a isoform X2 [Corythoichthys intestinalis]|uniref:histone-lysine N-methyltransferase EHMT1a isoform X2 n=1 Tax=Corythoichthys intestinalis TaxID=161448 RepID=UPI0025A64DE2|nr:histone-lysine N-methyltransferase EHMT1a isoform X2 [Corythoichthys intestinalis]
MDDSGTKEGPGPDMGPLNNLGKTARTRLKKKDSSRVEATPFHIVSEVRSNRGTRPASVKRLGLPGPTGHWNAQHGQKVESVDASIGSTDAKSSSAKTELVKSIEKTHKSTRGYLPTRSKAKLDMEDMYTSVPTEAIDGCVNGEKSVSFTSTKPHPAVKRKKRKMGLYNFVPKKKAKPVKQLEKVRNVGADGVIPAITKSGETSSMRSESFREGQSGEASHAEYTELNLDCIDLKLQEELLLPQSTALSDVMESDLAEELPLCCCRMETPSSGDRLSKNDQTCMAMESTEGVLNRCQNNVIKHEMMRPSNVVHMQVLCENHRASMVKHQCCPGCGVFCAAGTFMECQPYGNISHRFHKSCASILKDRRFCPHCGEDASGAKEVTVPSPSSPLLPTLPPKPAKQILKAKKTSEPQRSREMNLNSTAARSPNESLETILTGLDDENLKPTKVNYTTRELFISAKEGELQRVIRLLVDGKDPNFLMDVQNKRTPLHAAATEGHEEICHMLIQAGANLEMLDEEQRTPLMAACVNNQLETVKYLIRAGAAINHKDSMGFTCLHLASKLGHYYVVQHLLSKTSKYINCQDVGGWTPITWAIEYKRENVFYLLLAKGADVNIRDREQNICLHWAALSGCANVTQALLDAKCDQNSVNVHGDLPIHVAARENHLECVMLFLTNGVNLSHKNRDGQTALDCSINGSKVWMALNASAKLSDTRGNRGEQVLIRDISRGYEALPISCVNGVDDRPYPGNFKYIPDNCVTSPVNIDCDITHLQHCSCTDDCSSSTCTCGQLSLQCWYDSEGCLLMDFCQQDPPVLFECNHACLCWRTCKNRVVQHGLRVQLQVFRTEKMGWGVRVMQDVPQGTFICEYVGEIITDTEANNRENDSYLFTLNDKVDDVHCIDARLFGNIGRFINHLCEPNLLAVKVFTMHQDMRFPRIAFFSNKTIKAGDQIGFDYGDHYWMVKSKYLSCQCGSPVCRYSERLTSMITL